MNIETVVHLDLFKPRWYQLPILDSIENKGYKRVVAILPRRSGKDITAWNLCIRKCIFEIGVYYYIFPFQTQAKKAIWDTVTIDGKRFLDFIPPEVVQSTNSNEMKIRFKNGSLLQLCGSDNVDSLVGTNPRGIVYSEYALQLPTSYTFLSPVLAANDGWAVFLSCVAPDTMVITGDGPRQIQDVCDSRLRYTDLENVKIWGIGGFHWADQFFHQKHVPLLKITNRLGYEIKCTPNHQLWNGKDWIRAEDIKIGMQFPIQLNQQHFGPGIDIAPFLAHAPAHHDDGVEPELYPDTCCGHFYYLLGVLHQLCTISPNFNTITLQAPKYIEMVHLFRRWGFKPTGMGDVVLRSRRMIHILMNIFDFTANTYNRPFPHILYRGNREQLSAFIQGVMDASCNLHRGGTECFSIMNIYDPFARELQRFMLIYGIVTGISRTISSSRFYIPRCQQDEFFKQIGFGVSIKKELRGRKKKVGRPTRYHFEYTDTNDKLYYNPVQKIEKIQGDVFDFVIPDTNSFFSNGFISHNTPRGKNHLYELYQIAQSSKEWFSYLLTVEDTQHIPLSVIQREKEEGLMSDDLIQQEYYCSFDMGIEGSIYNKYLDRMRVKGQIAPVPWESSLKVHTAWDIGVADSTSIIFFQVAGQIVRIIDYYEQSGVGLDHYVKILQSKPYIYGKHIAPHDMKQRVWTEGAITRVEKARQMGINFTIAPQVEVIDGIEAVRASFNKIWIDDYNCSVLLKALENYRYEWDPHKSVYKTKPLHNWASHACFTADTEVITSKGIIPISYIINGDLVLTKDGWKRCIGNAWISRNNAPLVEVNFNDKYSVKCTPDHRFLLGYSGLIDKWREAKNLTAGDPIQSFILITREELVRFFQYCGITNSDFDAHLIKHNNHLSNLQIAITKLLTTIISNPLHDYNDSYKIMKDIVNYTQEFSSNFLSFKESIKRFIIFLKNLTIQKNDKIEKIFINLLEGILFESKRYCSSSLTKDIDNIFDHINLDKLKKCSDIFQKYSKLHDLKIFSINILNEYSDVWDIAVEENHQFSLANGAIVHNSDAMRYLCISLPKLRDGMSPTDMDKMYEEAVLGSNANMPSIFRNDLPQY